MQKKPNVDVQLKDIEFSFLQAKQRLLALEHSALCESLRQNRAERKQLKKRMEELFK